MKVKWLVAVNAERNGGTFLAGFVALAAVAMLSLAPPAANAADPGGSVGKTPAVTVEKIPGSTAKRIILTSRAAERLGIATGKVSEEPVIRKQVVSGLVMPPRPQQAEMQPAAGALGGFGRGATVPALQPAGGTFGGFGQTAAVPASQPAGGTFGGFGQAAAVQAPPPASGSSGSLEKKEAAPTAQPVPTPARVPATGDVWVQVTLSPAEYERLAKDKPARLVPLDTRDKLEYDVFAQPSGMPPVEDMKRSMLSLYYVVPGKDHGLTVDTRMRAELQIEGSGEKQKVVPYSAVYYDGKGTSWVYVNPKPLEFERKRIRVERVLGDFAVLSEGPPVGTPVVTVGAALLYGAEIFGK